MSAPDDRRKFGADHGIPFPGFIIPVGPVFDLIDVNCAVLRGRTYLENGREIVKSPAKGTTAG